jgi:hypothetical protein
LGKHKKDGKWSLFIICNKHNHNPFTEIIGHPNTRLLTKEDKTLVYKIITARASKHQVLTALCQENKPILAIAKMVYNAKANTLANVV